MSIGCLAAFSTCASVEVQKHLQAGVNLVAEDNLFWKLSETFAPNVDYSTNTTYLEGYVKPGASFEYLTESAKWYGKGSAVLSYTSGIDPYDEGNTGRLTLEEAYAGYTASIDDNLTLDISVGAREFKLGSGMLIANGGVSGFERGALKLGPRKAWERSAIVRVNSPSIAATAYYIDPNELDSNNTNTQIYGVDVNLPLTKSDGILGLTYGHVLESGAPYPKAAPNGIGPPVILENARDNLSFVNHYGKATLYQDEDIKYVAEWDGAYQWNDDLDLTSWGGRIKLGVTLLKKKWVPTFTYSWQAFSGDDPLTEGVERFDPLYYEGSPSAWSTGSKSSMVFINSNVEAHHFALNVIPSPRHILTFRAAHIRVNELGSPVQFGQAARVDFSDGLSTVISGVTEAHLADDIFLEYTYLKSESVFITLGYSVSFPGDGINSALGQRAPNWPGGFANVVVYL
ncbi:hypothetical protein [Alteromonas sp. KUL49]|uniref:hypothetical protein n=1 Tax=Alteromonas sp. KUL49 TaxID=2480798 RepID=UPI00102EF573|nr:hypothetical protein [Alteromonas sp. KUL49]TAP42333.1 hypothetical protein EYS00_01570 [Alteromonas sp. KUL49]